MANDFLKSLMDTIETKDGERNADGLLVCPSCGKPKEYLSKRFPKPVPVMCDCEKAKYRESELRRKTAAFIMSLRGMWDSDEICETSFKYERFEDDDGETNVDNMTFCKHYADHWEEYYKEDIGIFMYGHKEAGKSFAAHCIANQVISMGVTACVTSMPRLMNIETKSNIADRLKRYELLVIDDIGAERTTSYGQEFLYNIIDSRYQSRLPLIVTSNLDFYADVQESDNRSYSRIVQMCPIVLRFEEANKRKKIAESALDKARRIMTNA